MTEEQLRYGIRNIFTQQKSGLLEAAKESLENKLHKLITPAEVLTYIVNDLTGNKLLLDYINSHMHYLYKMTIGVQGADWGENDGRYSAMLYDELSYDSYAMDNILPKLYDKRCTLLGKCSPENCGIADPITYSCIAETYITEEGGLLMVHSRDYSIGSTVFTSRETAYDYSAPYSMSEIEDLLPDYLQGLWEDI